AVLLGRLFVNPLQMNHDFDPPSSWSEGAIVRAAPAAASRDSRAGSLARSTLTMPAADLSFVPTFHDDIQLSLHLEHLHIARFHSASLTATCAANVGVVVHAAEHKSAS